MTLIIAMAAFILVTTLFILDASKDQNLSSEVSTFLKPFFAETVVNKVLALNTISLGAH